MTRSTRILTSLLAAAIVAGGCGGDDKKSEPAPTTAASTTTTSTTAAAPTTTTEPVPVATAPLTGMPIDEATLARLARPALAVKLDNAAGAMPHEGLNEADIVWEIKVEGISRLMAVFHSTDSSEIGPTRSARYSDPPILALLGKPLFGWSGANEGVSRDVYRSDWIVNVNWDRVKNSDYFRKKGRKAPHNLFTSTAALWAYTEPDQPTAQQVFQYREVAEPNTAGLPVPGASLSVGDTPSSWVWDAAGNQWLRWQYGKRHMNEGAGQSNAANVVIQEVQYKGGSKTPTAKTDGSGRVLVLTGGNLIEGTWNRPSQLEPMTLTAADGQPIRLTPGRTWVELTPGTTAKVLSPEAAAGLLNG